MRTLPRSMKKEEECMGTIGYAAMFEQFHPNDLLRWSRKAEDAGFGAHHGLRPLPSLGAAAGPGWIRLGVAGRARRADALGQIRHWRDGSRVPLPSGDSGAGLRYARSDVSGPLLPRHRRGRGAQRAHRRPILAGGADPLANPRRGYRGHSQALHAARSSSTRASTSRWSRAEALHHARDAAADLYRLIGSDQQRTHRAHRRRLHHRRRRQTTSCASC